MKNSKKGLNHNVLLLTYCVAMVQHVYGKVHDWFIGKSPQTNEVGIALAIQLHSTHSGYKEELCIVSKQ